MLAVKPQTDGRDAGRTSGASPAMARAVFLSIAAGQDAELFRRRLGATAKVVRSMPNTPAAVRQGITVACDGCGRVTAAEKKRCQELLEAVGQALCGPRTRR